MRRLTLLLTAGIAALAPIVLAQSTGLHKVLKTTRVGGEGGTDYIYADTVGRRLYHHARRDAGARGDGDAGGACV